MSSFPHSLLTSYAFWHTHLFTTRMLSQSTNPCLLQHQFVYYSFFYDNTTASLYVIGKLEKKLTKCVQNVFLTVTRLTSGVDCRASYCLFFLWCRATNEQWTPSCLHLLHHPSPAWNHNALANHPRWMSKVIMSSPLPERFIWESNSTAIDGKQYLRIGKHYALPF